MGNRQESITTFYTEVITATITRPANTTAYAAGDAISAVTTDAPHTFSISDKYMRSGAVSGAIDTLNVMTTKGTATPTLNLCFFEKTITETADNSAWSLSHADMLFFVGAIKIESTDWIDASASSIVTIANPSIAFRLHGDGQSGTSTLICQMVAGAAYTPDSAEEISIKLALSMD